MLIAGAALAAVATFAACGSSSPRGFSSSTVRGANSTGPALAFSRCMRAHGMPNFPDVNGHGMRIEASGQTLSVDGVSVNAPAFGAARRACEKYEPHIQATPAQTAQFQKQALKFARCMRSHGITNFPDLKPTIGPGGGQGVDLSGYGLNFQSPAFQDALNACGGPGALKGS